MLLVSEMTKSWCDEAYSTSDDVRNVLLKNLDYQKP